MGFCFNTVLAGGGGIYIFCLQVGRPITVGFTSGEALAVFVCYLARTGLKNG